MHINGESKESIRITFKPSFFFFCTDLFFLYIFLTVCFFTPNVPVAIHLNNESPSTTVLPKKKQKHWSSSMRYWKQEKSPWNPWGWVNEQQSFFFWVKQTKQCLEWHNNTWLVFMWYVKMENKVFTYFDWNCFGSKVWLPWLLYSKRKLGVKIITNAEGKINTLFYFVFVGKNNQIDTTILAPFTLKSIIYFSELFRWFLIKLNRAPEQKPLGFWVVFS